MSRSRNGLHLLLLLGAVLAQVGAVLVLPGSDVFLMLVGAAVALTVAATVPLHRPARGWVAAGAVVFGFYVAARLDADPALIATVVLLVACGVAAGRSALRARSEAALSGGLE